MGRTRAGLAVVGVAAMALLASGCIRVQVAAAVRADDTVTGELVVASVTQKPEDLGTVFTPPSDIAAKVRTQPYRENDFAGTRVLFEGLTFEEFGRLNQVPGGEANRLRMQLRRAGGLVLFTARVDLTQVPAPERANVGIRLSFPGRVTSTNGKQSGNEVS